MKDGHYTDQAALFEMISYLMVPFQFLLTRHRECLPPHSLLQVPSHFSSSSSSLSSSSSSSYQQLLSNPNSSSSSSSFSLLFFVEINEKTHSQRGHSQLTQRFDTHRGKSDMGVADTHQWCLQCVRRHARARARHSKYMYASRSGAAKSKYKIQDDVHVSSH